MVAEKGKDLADHGRGSSKLSGNSSKTRSHSNLNLPIAISVGNDYDHGMQRKLKLLKLSLIRKACCRHPQLWEFFAVMNVLQTQQDLGRLREWARRKSLKGPLAAYERRYQKLEWVLARSRRRYGGTVLVCEFLQTAWAQLMPPPRPKRGSAAKYKYKNVRNGYRQNAYTAR